MNDNLLDENLAKLGERPISPGMQDAVHELGLRAVAQAASRSATHTQATHRMWKIGLAIAGAVVLLTAGATATAYYLSVPPFQSLPSGSTRTTESIPIDYRAHDGTAVKCREFLEFQHVDPAGMEAINRAIRLHDWAGFAQHLYDALPAAPSSAKDGLNPPDALTEPVINASFAFAAGVLPGLKLMSAGGPNDPTLSALATTCLPSAQ